MALFAYGHNIVITTLLASQEYGTGSAATLASQVKEFFSNLWFALFIDVANGLSNLSQNPSCDFRFDDVLVTFPESESAGGHVLAHYSLICD